jgi:hypothetical protein
MRLSFRSGEIVTGHYIRKKGKGKRKKHWGQQREKETG